MRLCVCLYRAFLSQFIFDVHVLCYFICPDMCVICKKKTTPLRDAHIEVHTTHTLLQGSDSFGDASSALGVKFCCLGALDNLPKKDSNIEVEGVKHSARFNTNLRSLLLCSNSLCFKNNSHASQSDRG